jgi:hypothetical protein
VKQYNKLRETNTVKMKVKKLTSYREALRLIKNDLNFPTQNMVEVHDEDNE